VKPETGAAVANPSTGDDAAAGDGVVEGTSPSASAGIGVDDSILNS
jgi:hypothetical protein